MKVGKILSNTCKSKAIVTYSGSNIFIIINFKKESLDEYSEKILNTLRNYG